MTTLASLTVKVLGDITGFMTSMDKAQRRSRSFSDSLRKSRAPLLALTGAATAMGLGALKSFGDFDQAMTQSLAIMGDVTEALEVDMVNAAEEVARTTTFSAKEAAESYFFLASAGLDAKGAIEALPAVAAFAQAGMFDMATATDLATDAQSALGLTIRDDAVANMENLVRVTDILVGANTLANASVQQFSESLTNKAGAALRMVGKDLEEGIAVLAAFADQGVKGSEAGTQLGIVMRDLQTKAIQNSSQFKSMGVAVFDSTGEMNNMADILADLEGLMAGMSDETKKATLLQLGFSDKSVAALQTLIGLSDQISIYESKLRDMGGITEEVAGKQLEAFNAQLKIGIDKVVIMASKFGSKLAPSVLVLVDKLGILVGWVSELDDKWVILIVTAGFLVGALGAIGLLLPPIITGFGLMAGAAAFVTGTMIPMTLSIWSQVAAWVALNVSTGGLVLAVGLIVTGIVLLAMKFGAVRDLIASGVSWITDKFNGFFNDLIDHMNGFIRTYNRTLGKVFGDIPTVSNIAMTAVEDDIESAAGKFKNFTIANGDEFEEMGDRMGAVYDEQETSSNDFYKNETSNLETLQTRFAGYYADRISNEEEMIAKLLFMGADLNNQVGEGEEISLQNHIDNNGLRLRAFEIFSDGFMTIDEALKMAEIEHIEEVADLKQAALDKELDGETTKLKTLSERFSEFNERRVSLEADVLAKLRFMSSAATNLALADEDLISEKYADSNALKLRAFEIYSEGFFTIDEAIKTAEIEHIEEVALLKKLALEQEISDLEELNKLTKDIAAEAFNDLRVAVGLLPSEISTNINQGLGSFGGQSDLLKGAGSNVFFDELGRMFGINQAGEAVLLGDQTRRAPQTEEQIRRGQKGTALEHFGDESEQGKRDRAALLAHANALLLKIAEQKPTVIINTPAVLGDNADEVIAVAFNRGLKRGLINLEPLSL